MKNPQPLIKKYSPRWWKAQISEAEERRKSFIDQAEESIRVYNAQKDRTVMNDVERRINVWWYCINTLLPAYYSSTPQAEVDLRKRSGSLPYQLGSVILERNTQYAMDVHFSFDQVGYLAALQFLLTGQAVLWARYAPRFETVMQEIALVKTPDGLMTGDGNPMKAIRLILSKLILTLSWCLLRLSAKLTRKRSWTLFNTTIIFALMPEQKPK